MFNFLLKLLDHFHVKFFNETDYYTFFKKHVEDGLSIDDLKAFFLEKISKSDIKKILLTKNFNILKFSFFKTLKKTHLTPNDKVFLKRLIYYVDLNKKVDLAYDLKVQYINKLSKSIYQNEVLSSYNFNAKKYNKTINKVFNQNIFYNNILFKKSSFPKNLNNKDFNSSLNDFIIDKKILVVGPIGEFSIEDTYGYDTICFIKPTKLSFKLNQKVLIYFNAQHTLNSSILNFQHLRSSNCLFISKIDSIHADRTFQKNILFPLGSPMMLQNILFDLLSFSPSKIKIMNFNFYASSNIYNKDYIVENKDILRNSMIRRISLVLHDYYCNYIFVKNLFNAGLIDCSDECSKILKMDDFEYIEKVKIFN